jgi:hypothetical protein
MTGLASCSDRIIALAGEEGTECQVLPYYLMPTGESLVTCFRMDLEDCPIEVTYTRNAHDSRGRLHSTVTLIHAQHNILEL